jgi:hypothetical protein
MRKTATLDWQFPEEDEWDNRIREGAALTIPRRGQRLWRALFATPLLAVVVWLASTYLWVEGQPEVTRPPGELQNGVELATQIKQNEQHSSAATVQPRALDPSDHLVAVEVIVTQTHPSAPPSAYRETRFYIRTTIGLLPMTPPPDFWGKPGALETANLRFVFRERDRATVERAAANTEALYTNLSHLLGLPSIADDDKLMFEVVPHRLTTGWRMTEKGFLVSSPLLLRIPVHVTKDTMLSQTMREALTGYIVREAEQQAQVRWQWQPMVDGLHLDR